MTPLEIEIILHYYCSAEDYRNGDHSAPAVKCALNRFLEDGLLVHEGFNVERFDDGRIRARYKVTDRALTYIAALESVPFPNQVWRMPQPWPQPESDSLALTLISRQRGKDAT